MQRRRGYEGGDAGDSFEDGVMGRSTAWTAVGGEGRMRGNDDDDDGVDEGERGESEEEGSRIAALVAAITLSARSCACLQERLWAFRARCPAKQVSLAKGPTIYAVVSTAVASTVFGGAPNGATKRVWGVPRWGGGAMRTSTLGPQVELPIPRHA